MAPHEPDGPGEMGKAVVLPKDLTPEQKKLVDEGWQKNAFNQYVSDMISVHRTLPDPRDDRSNSFSFSFFFSFLLATAAPIFGVGVAAAGGGGFN